MADKAGIRLIQLTLGFRGNRIEDHGGFAGTGHTGEHRDLFWGSRGSRYAGFVAGTINLDGLFHRVAHHEGSFLVSF